MTTGPLLAEVSWPGLALGAPARGLEDSSLRRRGLGTQLSPGARPPRWKGQRKRGWSWGGPLSGPALYVAVRPASLVAAAAVAVWVTGRLSLCSVSLFLHRKVLRTEV